MTDREKAIVMAYTGICMLEGKKLFEFYKYLEELYERPVYTHELLTLNMKERSEKDFMELCRREEPERTTGVWSSNLYSGIFRYNCSECNATHRARYDFCPSCGAKMKG